MPQLGETVAEGTVTNWYKTVGEAVKADEALFDVETDKVATEIPCPVSGVLTEVLVAAGQTVKVGTRLAVVRSASEQTDATGLAREGSDARARVAPPVPVVAPAQAGAQASASLLNSRLRGNDDASADIRAASSSGAQRDPQQKLSPVVRRLLAEHGLDASVISGSGRDGRVTRDDVQAYLARQVPGVQPASTPEAEVPFVVARGPGAAAAESMPMPAPAPAPASPGRDREFADHGPRRPSGIGLHADARPAREGPGMREDAAHARSETPHVFSPLPPAEGSGVREANQGERVVALNNIRRRSGAAMARAWQVVPHVLQAVEADYSRIEQARRSKQSAWQAREGFELTYLPFLAWAVCQALQRYEQLNARIDGDNLVVSRRVHLGIAVDLNHEGLVVPVIRDAQDRNVAALAREIRRIAVAARSNKLKPDDMSQPTYTISNSGVFGTLITAPIVNPPQVAILSTDGVSKRPVVVEAPEGDSIAVRPVGVLAQSFDHRAVDGAYSAAFLKELKSIVETRVWIDDLV